MKQFCTGVPTEPTKVNTCCEQHDADYTPNSGVLRSEADKKLRDCMINNGYKFRGWIFYIGVRLFGWAFYNNRWENLRTKIINLYKKL